MRLLLLAVLVVAVLACPSLARATTYYVTHAGSDRAAGSSPEHPWRTIDRVNDAELEPGDRVLFAGHERFIGTLLPRHSGAPGNPITFSSFGGSRARIASVDGAVWFGPGVSDIRLSALDLSSGGGPTGIVASAGNGAGSARITVVGCHLHDGGGTGVISPKASDSDWLVLQNTIDHTGDSGVIYLGSAFVVSGNAIHDTGLSHRISAPKHGIYAKGPAGTLADNVISHYESSGLTIRFHGTRVFGNTVGAGRIGIEFLSDERTSGTTTISGNTVTGTTDSGIYVAPRDEYATRETFVIARNTIRTATGNGLDLEHTAGGLTLERNTVDGGATIALNLKRPGGRLSERLNTWRREGGGAVVLVEGRTFGTRAALRAVGLGAGDVFG